MSRINHIAALLVLFTLTRLPAATPASSPARDISYNTVTTAALTPEEQRQTFRVPANFEVELVAAESEGFGKFIGLAWDARMRLWSMTALEYPVDGTNRRLLRMRSSPAADATRSSSSIRRTPQRRPVARPSPRRPVCLPTPW